MRIWNYKNQLVEVKKKIKLPANMLGAASYHSFAVLQLRKHATSSTVTVTLLQIDSKPFSLEPYNIKKIAAWGVDSRVVVWIREFLIGRSQRVRVGRHYSEEVRVTSGIPQRSVLSPHLFLACVNYIRRNIESKIRFFADDCIIYRKILNIKDVEKLQTDLDRLGGWVEGN